jgi:hypothetical protein
MESKEDDYRRMWMEEETRIKNISEEARRWCTSLLPAPCSLLPAPCSLLPAACCLLLAPRPCMSRSTVFLAVEHVGSRPNALGHARTLPWVSKCEGTAPFSFACVWVYHSLVDISELIRERMSVWERAREVVQNRNRNRNSVCDLTNLIS